jgi:hypothetical protein
LAQDNGMRGANSGKVGGPSDRLPLAHPVALSKAAETLLAALPAEVSPSRLAETFPHILNPYFDSLLIDDRGGRQGLPLGVALEILNLKEHYQTVVQPKRHDIWDGLYPAGSKKS